MTFAKTQLAAKKGAPYWKGEKVEDKLPQLVAEVVKKLETPWGQIDFKHVTLEDLRRFGQLVIQQCPASGAWWDLITALRGPDSPSERPDQTAAQQQEAYHGRRVRKAETVEIIRGAAFYGAVGGAARSRSGSYITLPPRNQWEHFDKHCDRAAQVLGLEVKIKGETATPKPKKAVTVGVGEDMFVFKTENGMGAFSEAIPIPGQFISLKGKSSDWCQQHGISKGCGCSSCEANLNAKGYTLK